MAKEKLKYTLSNDRLFKIVLNEEVYILDFCKKFEIVDDDFKEFIIENTEEVGSLNFKASNFDVKVKLVNEDDVISYINVEMQNAKTEYDMLDRLVLYLSKLIVRSQPKGSTYCKNNCICPAAAGPATPLPQKFPGMWDASWLPQRRTGTWWERT